jgi:Protein of unknown function (DUF3307)
LSSQLAILFWSLVLFEAKHFLCDFVLQTRAQLRSKASYGNRGGLIHAGLHGIASLPAILLLSHSVPLVPAIVAVEFAVHYHLDWLKAAINRARGLTYDDWLYWAVFGADQFLHQMTYVIILALLARAIAF